MIAARAAEILLRPPDAEAGRGLAEFAESPKPERRVAGTEVPAVTEARPQDFHVFIIEDDAQSCDVIANALSDYALEVAHDGATGLANLLALKPDLVVLDIDLPIIDGFKALENIRLSLNMPIIALSGTRVRAGDRVLAAELGADYYMTKPFSPKELRHKVRQLIARYRGINSWILNSPSSAAERAPRREAASTEPASPPRTEPIIVAVNTRSEGFLPYEEFSAHVEARVKTAMDSGAAFSIIGCSLPQMTASGGQLALRLFELMSSLVRDTDLVSTNSRNDIVVLLTDANANGARAFVSRLRDRVMSELRLEPTVWRRSFPDLEEAVGKQGASNTPNGGNIKRRLGDQQNTDNSPMPASEAAPTRQANA
jgi:CheY-like chemotaxis protein